MSSSSTSGKSGARTRAKSIVHMMFDEVTDDERIEKTRTILDQFLKVYHYNHAPNSREKKSTDPIECTFKVKGEGHGSGFFQILLRDVILLARKDSGWNSVFSQDGCSVRVKIMNQNALFPAQGPIGYPKRAYESAYGLSVPELKALIENKDATEYEAHPPSNVDTCGPTSISLDDIHVTQIDFRFHF